MASSESQFAWREYTMPKIPSPSGRGQGEGRKTCQILRPSPRASRVPLPEGEGPIDDPRTDEIANTVQCHHWHFRYAPDSGKQCRELNGQTECGQQYGELNDATHGNPFSSQRNQSRHEDHHEHRCACEWPAQSIQSEG